MRQRASVVLPLPDSPTIPSVRCRASESETSSTAVSARRRACARAWSATRAPQVEALHEAGHLEQRLRAHAGPPAERAGGHVARAGGHRAPSSPRRTRRGQLGQRGRNGQPGGSRARSGGWPLICGSRPRGPARPDRRQRLEQRARVRVARRRGRASPPGASSTTWPGVHHGDRVAVLRDDAEVVGDEHHRHPELVLELGEQREDLILDRDVERGRRLVGEQQLRPARRSRSRSSPAGACRRSARAGRSRAAASRRRDADVVEQLDRARPRAARPPRPSFTRSVSAIWSPIVKTGFRQLVGSWKIIAISRPRIAPQLARRRGRAGRGRPSSTSPPIDPARLGHEPEQRAQGHALARARTRRRAPSSRPRRARS